MTRIRLHAWDQIHRWSSLVCSLFLLLICLTGLPLIFTEEIGQWLDDGPPYATLPADAPLAGIDGLIAESRRRYPADVILSAFMDDAEPQVRIRMAPSYQIAVDNPKRIHYLKYDARTGAVMEDSLQHEPGRLRLLAFVLRLHTDLFTGLAGELFFAAMAFLFLVAIISGIVLYGPFMKKLKFGTIRSDRSRRLQWLDMHNLLGIATLAWALLVGASGILNEFTKPLFSLWQSQDVQAMLQPWQGQPTPPPAALSSLDAAFDTARKAVPDMRVISVEYPGNLFATPYHYLIWAKGNTPLTSRLFSPVMVDARSGALTAVVQMPWYLRALEVSRPIHFGDYGGLPMKIIWAILDLLTIVVLISGLYLWFARRKAAQARLQKLHRLPSP